MPEWYVVIATLTALSALGLFWKPLLLALPLLGYAVGVLLVQAGLSARHASFTSAPQSRTERLQLWGSDDHTASDATPGTAAWTLALWSDALAVAEYAGLGLALVADIAAVE